MERELKLFAAAAAAAGAEQLLLQPSRGREEAVLSLPPSRSPLLRRESSVTLVCGGARTLLRRISLGHSPTNAIWIVHYLP